MPLRLFPCCSPTKLTAALVLLLITHFHGFSQQAAIKGTVIDTSEKKNLAYAVVALLRSKDSVMVTFSRTDNNGNFTLQKLSPGSFLIMVTRPAYADYFEKISIEGSGTRDVGRIPLILKSQLLQEVVVSHKLGAIRIKGDTTEYVADSFKLGSGATVEDLLKRLPGIQVDKDGKITAQGESVQKVLVDGEEFFSDDPTIATRGLTSDAVDKVQVYDKKSDQATFTGVDDGSKTKTIDLKLKEDRKNGYFGKIEVGSNGDQYWNNSGMFNAFKGKRKFSVFSLMSSTGKTGLDWTESMNYAGGDIDFDSQEDGIDVLSIEDNEFGYEGDWGSGFPKGWAGGLHYSNKWNADKMHLNGGYQFNKLNVAPRGITQNRYILPDTILSVNDNGNNINSKERHKLDAVYEFQVDSLSSVKLSVSGSTGTSNSVDNFHSESSNNYGDLLGIINRQVTAATDRDRFNAALLWRQRFKKVGRTVSVAARYEYNNVNSAGKLVSDNYFFGNGGLDSTKIDQQKLRDNKTSTLYTRAVYTEPLTKRSLLEFSYSIDNANRESHIATLEKSGSTDPKYDRLIDSLSNDYRFEVLTHNGGVAWRYARPKKITASVGMNVSKAVFNRQDLQDKNSFRYSFTNYFPQVNLTYNLGPNGNIRFTYNGKTQPPGIDLIQPIQDNTDQLNIRIGNPDLKQAFRHEFNLSYRSFKFLSEQSLYTGFSGSTTQNDFSTISFIDLKTGKQIIQPQNVHGNYHISNWSHYLIKIKKWNVMVGGVVHADLNRNSNFIDNLRNENKNYSFGGGPQLSYDKEKKFSIRMHLGFTKNLLKQSLQPDLVTQYWTQEHDIWGNVFLPWKLELASDVKFNFRQRTSAFENNNNAVCWNARVDRKLFKNDVGRIRFQAFDILDQNIDFYRSINNNFTTERSYETISRYFMLSFIWNFNKNGKPMQW